MTTAKTQAVRDVIGTAAVDVVRLPDNSFMGFHREHGSGEFPFGNVRFCQSLNNDRFWLEVKKPDGEGWSLYAVSTEELMNAILNTIAPLHDR